MRLIVMFDLPTVTSTDLKNYRKFRKFLIENGYSMMQYSVYSKIILNRTVLNFQMKKLRDNAPKNGYIEALIVTEKQYANIEIIVGEDQRSYQLHSTERLMEL